MHWISDREVAGNWNLLWTVYSRGRSANQIVMGLLEVERNIEQYADDF